MGVTWFDCSPQAIFPRDISGDVPADPQDTFGLTTAAHPIIKKSWSQIRLPVTSSH